MESRRVSPSDATVRFRWLLRASWFVPSIALVLLAIYSAQFSWAKFLSTFSITLLIALAALVAGLLLGFLFGIPRALQQPSGPPEANNYTTNYAVNTNLEQISDWLTKILVGLGLIELGRISAQFGRLTLILGVSIGPAHTGPLVAGAEMILFATWGFLLGYLMTRTYLTAAFRAFDVDEIAARAAHEAAQEVNQTSEDRQREQDLIDARALSLASQLLTPGASSDDLPDRERVIELEQLLAKASPPMVEQIYQLARTLRTANWSWRSAVTGPENARKRHERTVPIFDMLTKLAPDDYRYRGDFGFSLKDKEAPDYMESIRQLTIAIDLAVERGATQAVAWYSINRAIAKIAFGNQVGFANAHFSPTEILEDIQVAETYGGGPARAAQQKLVEDWCAKNGKVSLSQSLNLAVQMMLLHSTLPPAYSNRRNPRSACKETTPRDEQ